MKTIFLITMILIGNIASVLSHDGEWIEFEKAPQDLLRGHEEDTFPPAGWSQEKACFNLDSYGFGSDLMTKEIFREFELEFDWMLEEGGNSGVFFAIQTGEPYSYMTGLEIQLLDDAHHPDGMSELTSLGALYGLSAPLPNGKKNLKLQKMNSSRLIVKDGRARFFVNQVLIGDYSLNDEEMKAKISESKFKEMKNFYKKDSGHILFQDHGGKASFCNIRMRPL